MKSKLSIALLAFSLGFLNQCTNEESERGFTTSVGSFFVDGIAVNLALGTAAYFDLSEGDLTQSRLLMILSESVEFNSGGPGRGIAVTLDVNGALVSERTYGVQDEDPSIELTLQYIIENQSATALYTVTPESMGTLSITDFDLDSSTMSGTFSGTFIKAEEDPAGNQFPASIQIENGTFTDVPLQIGENNG